MNTNVKFIEHIADIGSFKDLLAYVSETAEAAGGSFDTKHFGNVLMKINTK